MMAPPAAHASKQKAKSCSGVESDGAVSSSSEGEEDADNTAAALWLENLLPLPLACSIVSSVLPFPQSMNSRVLTASPTAECNAVLGYVQVLHTRSTPSHHRRSFIFPSATRPQATQFISVTSTMPLESL